MMTIREFARLCACSAQTLRYYDKIDLLKPVKVDPWSGYRYYAPTQAIDFVKIKNLQAADFTIGEIKSLLTQPDQQVYEAFDRKIAEQTQKLERIREIQQSYLTEKNTMEKIVQSLSDFLLSRCTSFEALKEFGLSPADAPEVLTCLRAYLNRHLQPDANWSEVTLTVNGEVIRGEEQVLDRIQALTGETSLSTIQLSDSVLSQDDGSVFDPGEYEALWERHGWEHASEFIDSIPALEQGRDYCFRILLKGDQYKDDPSYAMFLLGAMLLKRQADGIAMSCSVERSADGENHFTLLRGKRDT